MIHRIARRARGEEGSILIGAIMLTVVLTLLGFALFDLAQLESRLALGTEADYRAFEIAQAGIERALQQLFLDLCDGSVSCLSPPANPSWTDGTINATSFALTPTNFATFFNTTTAFSGTFGGETYAGTYTVEMKHVANSLSTPEAQNLGIFCSEDPCKNYIFVRSRGNFTSGVGTSTTRTIQVLVTNIFNGLGDGIVAGAPAAGSITGNVEIHGSLHIVPCGSKPACDPLVFSGGAGIRNNYNGLPDSLQDLIPLLPRVTCVLGTACAGTLVETLGATVRMAYPQPGPLIDIQSNATTIGESGGGSTNSYPGGVTGKPTMDGVFVGTGCAAGVSPLCSDAVGSRPGNVYLDSPIKAYDQSPEPSYPSLDDTFTANSQNYDDYAACSGPGACNTSGAVVSGSGNDFFISHALKITSSTLEDAWACESCGGLPRNLLDILSKRSGLKWEDDTDGWSKTFSCTMGAPPVSCNDAGGNRVSGSVNGSTPAGFQMEWDKSTRTFSIYQCPLTSPDASLTCSAPAALLVAGSGVTAGVHRWKVTLVTGSGESVPTGGSNYLNVPSAGNRQVAVTLPIGPAGTTARKVYRTKAGNTRDYYLVTTINNNTGVSFTDTASDGSLGASAPTGLLSDPSNSVLPILVYVDDRLKICEDCNNKTFYFRGAAAFVVKGTSSDISSDLPSIAVDPNWLALPDGLPCPSPSSTNHCTFPQKSAIWFYTPGNIFMGLRAQVNQMGYWYAGNKWKTTKQTNVLGGVTARIFDVTGQVPSFWQVNAPRSSTSFPPRGQRYSVSTTRWKECVGAVPAGAC